MLRKQGRLLTALQVAKLSFVYTMNPQGQVLRAFCRFIVAHDDIAIGEWITIGIDHLVDFLSVTVDSAFDAIPTLTLVSPRSREL